MLNGKKVGAIMGVVLVVLLILASFLGEFFQTIQPAHKGIVIKGGALQENVLADGFYLKTPYWTQIVPVFVGQNSTDNSANVDSYRWIEPLSKDGQKMNIDAQIEYSIIDPIKFRETVGSTTPADIEKLTLITQIRGLLYDYTAEYTWKNLVQGGERQELQQRIFMTMTTGTMTKRVCKDEKITVNKDTWIEKIELAGCEIKESNKLSPVSEKGVAITNLVLRKVAPNEKIIAAVEQAQQKEQEVLVAEQMAEIEKQKAQQLIEKKRGQTESSKLEAEASAYKIRVELEEKAEGIKAEALAMIEQAKAQKALNAALQDSNSLIEYKRLDVEMVIAEAQLEYARHYTGAVPNSINVIWTDEAKGMSIIMGNWIPAISVK